MEDNQLITGLKNNDRKSILYLYENMYPVVESFVLKNGGEKDDAQNLFQDALIVLYRKVVDNDFELTVKLQTYLYAIARNHWLHKLRRSEKYHLKLSTVESDFDEHIIESDFLSKKEKEEEESTNLKLLKIAIDNLPEECRSILLMEYFEGNSLTEIIEKLGYTNSYVRVKRLRCMDRLKKEMKILSEKNTKQS